MRLTTLKYDFEKLHEIQEMVLAKYGDEYTEIALKAMAIAGGYDNVDQMLMTLFLCEIEAFTADLVKHLSNRSLIQADYNGELGNFEVPLDSDVWGEISEILGGDSNE